MGQLEAAHAVIGTITINNQNIFDTTDPKENTWLFRLANRLHYRTRAGVIRARDGALRLAVTNAGNIRIGSPPCLCRCRKDGKRFW